MHSAEILNPLPWQNDAWEQMLKQARQERLAHAYLLSGSEGIGKRRFACARAAALLCQQPRDNTACGQCAACHWFLAGSHPDFLEVAPEEGRQGIRIEQVRRIAEFAQRTAGSGGSAKVIILGPAETLGIAAANALLKSLEEPPGNTCFLLYAHLPGRVLPTVRSRCQPLPMAPAGEKEALQWLEQRSGSRDGVREAAALAPGRPLAALAMIEAGVPQLQQKLVTALRQLQGRRILPIDCVRELEGQDPAYVVQFMQFYVASLIRRRLVDNTAATEAVPVRELAGFEFDPAEGVAQSRQLFSFYSELNRMRRQLAGTANPNARLMLESLFLRWSDVLGQCL